MSNYQPKPFGKKFTAYERVEIFAAHERDGEVVDKRKLQLMADRANQQTSIGHLYYLTLTHNGKESVGWMRNYRVGTSTVVVGDKLVRNCPTLFADWVVKNEVAAQIEEGTWPRRSCTAEISDGRLISCSLLGVHEESWFGFKDIGGSRYSAVIGTVGNTKIAMYSKETNKMDPTESMNKAAAEDSEPEAVEETPEPEETPEVEPEPEVEPAPEPRDELDAKLDRVERILDMVLKMEKAAVTTEPEPEPEVAAEPLPDEAEMAVEEELESYKCKGYSEYAAEAKEKIKKSGKNIDLEKATGSFRKLYKQYGQGAAERFIDGLIESTPAAPGADPGEEVAASNDVVQIAKYNQEQQKIINACVSKHSTKKVSDALQRYRDYCANYVGGPEGMVSLEDHLRYIERLK